MAHVTRSSCISAEPQAIWGVLAAFGHLRRLDESLDHSSLLRDGLLAVGLTRRVQGGRLVVLERVVEVDEPRSLTYDIEGLPGPAASVRNRWRLEPAGDDATDVHVTTTVTIGSRPPQRLIEHVMARLVATRSNKMLEGLATQTESTHV